MPRKGKDKTVEQKSQQKDSWVFFVNDELQNSHVAACTLRHPRQDSGAVFLISLENNHVFELSCFKEECRSWFIGNNVLNDNELYLTSPVDPLFLVLPYFAKPDKCKRYMTLDQIVSDEELPDSHKLLACCQLDQLSLITDSKCIDDDDTHVYRYNKEKTLQWLKKKTEVLAEILKKKQISTNTSGAHSAMFIRSKDAGTSTDALLKCACGILSDYLSTSLEQDLRDLLGVKELNEKAQDPDDSTENEPPCKKSKQSTDMAPTDDYSGVFDQKKEKSKTSKLTAAQRKLSKVDKTGMKSIASFFSPKQ